MRSGMFRLPLSADAYGQYPKPSIYLPSMSPAFN
jgi:hypothetical protein